METRKQMLYRLLPNIVALKYNPLELGNLELQPPQTGQTKTKRSIVTTQKGF
jgi:hypothetical protein